MKNKFKNKVVWITGGGSGLGKEMALQFAREGASVAVSGRRKDKLEETVQKIETDGGQGLVVPCDVTKEQQIIEAVEQITKSFGELDIAVANAATAIRGSIEELDNHDWNRLFDVNVFGLSMMIKYALPKLRKTNGRLVLIASGASLSAFPGAVTYTASKYAVRAIGQTIAMELHGTGVSCTTIYPGYLDTELSQVDKKGNFNPNIKKPKSSLMWSAEKAAKVCINAIHKRKREFKFTALVKIMGRLGYHFPGFYHFLITRFGKKLGVDFTD